MKDLVKKTLSKNPWRSDLDSRVKSIAGVYSVGSFGLMALVVNNTAWQQLMISLIVFSPFWFSLGFIKSFRKSLVRDTKWKTLRSVLVAIIRGIFVSVAGFGYVGFVNALSSGKEVHLAAGKIEKLERGGRTGPRVFVFDGQSTIPNIPVTNDEYATLHPGDYYASNLRLGGLGYYYRWRFDSWNRGWETEIVMYKRDAAGREMQ
jgi:hypothetical protein